MTGIEYEETVAATRVETLIECFTPKCQVISLILALSDDGESETLVLQRNIEDSEDDEGVCIVLSPLQVFSYEKFVGLSLARSSLGMTAFYRIKCYESLFAGFFSTLFKS